MKNAQFGVRSAVTRMGQGHKVTNGDGTFKMHRDGSIWRTSTCGTRTKHSRTAVAFRTACKLDKFSQV